MADETTPKTPRSEGRSSTAARYDVNRGRAPGLATTGAPTTAAQTFPRGVSDPHCPNGHVLQRTTSTDTDHRLLWHIETALAVSATNDTLRELGTDLRRYLNATCQHHWHHYAGDDDIPAHRQCLWCCDVIWTAGDPSQETAPSKAVSHAH